MWSLEPPGADQLLGKLAASGSSLREVMRSKPLRGLLTGLNEAFMIDGVTREALLAADPQSEKLIRRYVRGQDVSRWRAEWAGLWMIAVKSSGDHPWPWANAGENAETVFRDAFPAVHAHLNHFRDALIRRQDQGRFWWELRSCAYWEAFNKPKIFYQDITWQPQLCFDDNGTLCNNTVYFLPTSDLWVMAVLNSPIGWWYAWRKAQHGKDEALRFFTEFVEKFPIPLPSEEQRRLVEMAIPQLIAIADARNKGTMDFLDWLKVEYDLSKFSKRLQVPTSLTEDQLIAEVRKLRGKSKPLSPILLRSLRDGYGQSVPDLVKFESEAKDIEAGVSNAVNAAFKLSAKEVELMWETAPPRTPLAPKSVS